MISGVKPSANHLNFEGPCAQARLSSNHYNCHHHHRQRLSFDQHNSHLQQTVVLCSGQLKKQEGYFMISGVKPSDGKLYTCVKQREKIEETEKIVIDYH